MASPSRSNTELESDLPLLLSDPAELREALINLIFNSVDALPQGGTITLVTRSVSPPANGDNPPPEPRIQVEVRDDGMGMDEKTRQHCLEPFFSTKASRGGTGLGLAMVYGMMQRHEGAIEIESAPGQGTCIRLIFPRPGNNFVTRPVPRAAAHSKTLSPHPLHRRRITDSGTAQELSHHPGHRVTTAANGKQGVELFRAAMREKQPYQTVITDLGMPDIDGHQVARTVKAESPGTPVIMMTGWGKIMKDDGELVSGVDAVVGKPPRIKELNSNSSSGLLHSLRPQKSPSNPLACRRLFDCGKTNRARLLFPLRSHRMGGERVRVR